MERYPILWILSFKILRLKRYIPIERIIFLMGFYIRSDIVSWVCQLGQKEKGDTIGKQSIKGRKAN